MELRHLRYFVAVAELLHFGRAAGLLRIAQPSLSHQILQLEAELQTKLLERTKRRVQLTESGRLFLEEAREILARADRAAVIARRTAHGAPGRLRVGFAYWMDATKLVEVVRRLDDRQPVVRLEIREMSVHLQIAALKEERLDAGFVRLPVTERPLNSESLAAESFIVALPLRHRFSAMPRVRLSALSNEPFIFFPPDSVPQFYDLAIKLCRDAGFVPNVRDEVDHPDLLLRLVAAGVGISLVPSSARKTPRPGVVFRALDPSPRLLETAVAWRRDNSSPTLNLFLEVAREVFALPPSAGN